MMKMRAEQQDSVASISWLSWLRSSRTVLAGWGFISPLSMSDILLKLSSRLSRNCHFNYTSLFVSHYRHFQQNRKTYSFFMAFVALPLPYTHLHTLHKPMHSVKQLTASLETGHR